MTDLEMTKLCADALGLQVVDTYEDHTVVVQPDDTSDEFTWEYCPLHDDAQAMALVKKMGLDVITNKGTDDPATWGAYSNDNSHVFAESADLNRAICECVAKMQEAK